MLLAEKGWGEPDLMEVGYSIVILENGNVSYCSHPLFIVPYILYYPLSVFEGVCVCVCVLTKWDKLKSLYLCLWIH